MTENVRAFTQRHSGNINDTYIYDTGAKAITCRRTESDTDDQIRGYVKVFFCVFIRRLLMRTGYFVATAAAIRLKLSSPLAVFYPASPDCE